MDVASLAHNAMRTCFRHYSGINGLVAKDAAFMYPTFLAEGNENVFPNVVLGLGRHSPTMSQSGIRWLAHSGQGKGLGGDPR